MRARRFSPTRALSGVVGLMCLGWGINQLRSDGAGLQRTHTDVDGVPVTIVVPANGPKVPVVVVAHGFAGCRQLMQAFSFTLAQNGYAVIAFDFPGHGTNPRPLGGTLGSEARTTSLRRALTRVVERARSLPQGNGRVALLGHSMAGDILVRHAMDDPNITTIVGLSPYLHRPPPADALRIPMLIAYGGWEADMLVDLGRRAIAEVAEGVDPAEVQPDQLYGQYGKRSLILIDSAEHIGILFAPQALERSVEWLDDTFKRDRGDAPRVHARRVGLIAWYLGVVLVGFAVVGWLPRVTAAPAGAGLRGLRFLVAAGLPALLTPAILTIVPTDFLPSILTDYIALHFAVYGALTSIILWRFGAHPKALVQGLHLPAFAVALGAVVLFELVVLGLATDHFLSAYFPGPNRGAATVAAFIGAVVWFSVDEWLTHGPSAPRGAYVATKVLFIVSLFIAVVLNPGELFFLVLIIPAIFALFVVYGLFSGWINRQTGHPLVAAIAHALAFALAISATFPVVDS